MPLTVTEIVDGVAVIESTEGSSSAKNATAIRLSKSLAEYPVLGVVEAIPGAENLVCFFNPDLVTAAEIVTGLSAQANVTVDDERRDVVIPVSYGGHRGPDLADVASAGRMSVEQAIHLHGSATYRVDFLGFAPGFPYLSGLPPELHMPRLSSPRPRVPSGSVAIASHYSGIYPADAPGGWRLIGHTPLRLFDPRKIPPALLSPGDQVRFESISEGAVGPTAPRSATLDNELCRKIAVLRVRSPGPATRIEGAPRFGWGRWGVPAGGAMDFASLAEANARLGNPLGAAGLEVTVGPASFEALSAARCCLQGAIVDARIDERLLMPGEPFGVAAGQLLEIGIIRRGLRVYLTVEQGLATTPLPGSPEASLRKGAILHTAPSRETAGFTVPLRTAWRGLLRVVLAPSKSRFSQRARETLFTSEYSVSAWSDRRGIRLEGPAIELIESTDIPPEGTAPGAIQVPGNGLPIILGPDRPVTGGYSKIATVIGADLSHLGQLRPGDKLHFEAVDLVHAKMARGTVK